MSSKKAFVLGNGTIIDNDYKKGTVIGDSEIYGGSFKKLRIMGSTKITGSTEIGKLSVMGNLEAKELATVDIAKLSCHCYFEKLDAKHIIMRWGDRNTEVYQLKGNVKAELLEVLTKCHLEGYFIIKSYLISGLLETAEEINCDNFICPGTVKSPSINASNIYIYPMAVSAVKELFGTTINIQRNFDKSFFNIPSRYSLKVHMRKALHENSQLELECIEADDIYIEHTKALHVSGKNVKIGPGCNIERLEYMESVSTASDAIIGTLQKI